MLFRKNKKTSTELRDKLETSAGVFNALIRSIEQARNQAVIAGNEASKEIEELKLVEKDSEEVATKATKLLKLLE